MSKSVTVIGGTVWTQRSVTWNGNVASGNVGGTSEAGDEPCADDPPGHAHGTRREWDTIQEGRNFTRRVKTS
jgi:hypothetical protein